MTMKREAFALAVVLAIILLLPASVLGYQASRGRSDDKRTIELVARSPGEGGWRPDAVRLVLGERVRFRIASADVVHSFAVPALDIAVDEILPGRVVEVEFVANRAGRFAFACTRWCSPDHWRMRGTLEVVDPGRPSIPAARQQPPFKQLGIDLDAARAADPAPARRPAAATGAALGVPLPPSLSDSDWLRAHAPAEAFAELRRDGAFAALSDDDVWSLVAFAWQKATKEETLARGERLYRRDCAACHGETGRGDGPAGRQLPGKALLDPHAKRGPADFTDAIKMLAASDALLHGKILRGGMGTGMPEWGSLYTDDDLWAVVGYLRQFTFDYAR